MSHTAKGWTAIIVIIALIIIGGAWYSMSHQPTDTTPAPAPAAQGGTTYQVTSDTSASNSSQSDSSDAALQSDLNSTDDQMNSLNADAAASAQ